MAKKRKRIRPSGPSERVRYMYPLDIKSDALGARILYKDEVFEARSVGVFEVEVSVSKVGTQRWQTMDLEALRADLALGADLWLMAMTATTIFPFAAPPTGEDFAQAWDRHRRLWSAANAN